MAPTFLGDPSASRADSRCAISISVAEGMGVKSSISAANAASWPLLKWRRFRLQESTKACGLLPATFGVIFAEVVRVVALAEFIQGLGSVPPIQNSALVNDDLVAQTIFSDIGFE